MFAFLRYYGRSLHAFLRVPVLRVLLFATVAILAFGTVFYHYTEDWSWVDSLYFCTITLATIGYGDLTPTKDFTKLFTVVYVLVGLGIVATFITTLLKAPLLIEPEDDDPRHAALRETILSTGLGGQH
ncbi:MAG TPA: potassium channel family protein, partial [Dehalococcoidia bacterium]